MFCSERPDKIELYATRAAGRGEHDEDESSEERCVWWLAAAVSLIDRPMDSTRDARYLDFVTHDSILF